MTAVHVVENLRFVVEAPDSSVRDLLHEMFLDLREGCAPGTAPLTSFRVERDGDSWLVGIPRGGSQRASSLAGALALLLAGVNISALDASPGRLHVHAAAVSQEGRAAVLAAARGTGKTTTAATLAHRGWSFITDETVFLAPDDDQIRGSARPLSIKPYGRALLPFLEAHLRPTLADEGEFQFVALGATGVEVVPDAAPHVVVLLRRAAAGPLPMAAVHRLHPADAVVGLMEETLDSGRYGQRSVARLARLAARSLCARVLVGEPESTADAIEELAARSSSPPVPVTQHPSSEAINPQVVSVRIGERAVLHHTGTGRLAALDETGTRVWEHLAGWRDDLAYEPDDGRVAGFVRDLMAREFLAGKL